LRARFEEGIDLSIDIDQRYYPTFIPPFTLQLLVENCIKHNVVSLERPLRIRVYSDRGAIAVENQLQPRKTREASTGMGLENINQRYTHLLDRHIDILPRDASFTVKLPIIYEDRHH